MQIKLHYIHIHLFVFNFLLYKGFIVFIKKIFLSLSLLLGSYVHNVAAAAAPEVLLYPIMYKKIQSEFSRGVFSISFSHKCDKIIISTGNGLAKIWQKEKQTNQYICRQTIVAHTDTVYSSSFSPDDNHIVTTSRDGTSKVWQWDTNTNQYIYLQMLDDHRSASEEGFSPAPISDAAISPDGSRIVTISANVIKVWQCNEQTQQYTRIQTIKKNSDIGKISFGSNKNYFVTTSRNGATEVWQWNEQANQYICQQSFESQGTWSISFCPEGTKIAIGKWGAADIWQWNEQTHEYNHIQTLKDCEGPVRSIIFNPTNSNQLITACGYGKTQIWQKDELTNQYRCIRILAAEKNSFSAASFSPNGAHIALTSDEGIIQIWSDPRVATQKKAAIFTLSQTAIARLGSHSPVSIIAQDTFLMKEIAQYIQIHAFQPQ